MLECTKCKKQKLPEEMSLDRTRRGGLSSWCKECRKESSRTWALKHTGRTIKKPVAYDTARGYILKHRYKMSLADYADLLDSQRGLCAVCGREASEMTYHLHVDHDHITGKVRGLLCAPCDVYLGYIKDNPEIANNLEVYINTHSKPHHSVKTKEEKTKRTKK